MAIARWLLLALLALVAGCATPRYQTVYRYEPPADPAARPCLARCEDELGECGTRCRNDYQACLKGIEGEVGKEYAEALKRYANALELYRFEIERARFNAWLDWRNGFWWYDPWPPYYISAMPPIAPSQEAIRARLARERCDDDCGCSARHDACFAGCGGTKVEETRCIANCPKQ